MLYTKLGRGEEAVSNVEAALRLQPDFMIAHQHLGNELIRQGRRDEAIEHLSTAVRLDPHLTEASQNLQVIRQDAQASSLAPTP